MASHLRFDVTIDFLMGFEDFDKLKLLNDVITNRGGRTCHAAIISRELGIPCVVGTVKGTRALKGVKDVTVDCSEGIGRIYEGKLKSAEMGFKKAIRNSDTPAPIQAESKELLEKIKRLRK